MAKNVFKGTIAVGDIVTIQKRQWKVIQIYEKEKRVRVVPMFDPPNDSWNEMITGFEDVSVK